MDAFAVLRDVLGDYEEFVRSFLTIRDPTVRRRVEQEIGDGLLWPEPWLGLNPAFAPGGTVSDLVAEGVLHERCRDIFRARSSSADHGHELGFHRHQADAFRLARQQRSYVLTTGTGSGKSLSYIVPIVDRVLREGTGRGVRAIVVYPMNALANSQLGELQKFLGTTKQAVTFARYTGQESKADREQILRDKPDILLTNYMMLELMLTRPFERQELIASADNLSFLVLDELHTYRGRQGADVAMLVRRLRGAVSGGHGIQCIGTSATLAGPGSDAEQRAEVAALARRVFGTTIGPDDIVGETLQRATQGDPGPDDLRARLTGPVPTTVEGLRRDPLAAWVETTFGLETKDGRLVRRRPATVRQAAEELATMTGAADDECQDAIRATLLAGSNARDDAGRALFAFKLHQFIGKGDTAYVTLEPAAQRYLTTQYQRSAPGEPRGRPLYPLSFCRECGQEYLGVVRRKDSDVLDPRATGPGSPPAEGTPGLLLVRGTDWPGTDAELLDLVPDEWILDEDGPRKLVEDRRKRLPQPVRVDPFGTVTDSGTPAAFFETLHFCPGCRTNYESTQASEFSRVATLGTEGRASAVSVLSQAVVRTLRSQHDLDDVARKFLAFSDNRQDASLQAGHFNDFVLVALIRSALHAAVRHQEAKDPDEPLTDENLAARIVDRLQVTPAEYAQDPEATTAIAKLTTRALRNVVAHLVWADLRRGWRITMPNLEQTGQLRLTYLGLEELAADAAWAAAGEPLASADTHTRFEVMRVLLEELRRNLCVATEHLTEERYEATRSAAAQRLTPSWQLGSEQGTYAAVCYAAPRPRGAQGVGSDLYLSGLGLYGKWLRRPRRFPGHGHPLKPDDAMGIIQALTTRLENAGFLDRIVVKNRPVGYQLKADVIEWRAGTGERRAEDPLRGARGEGRVNPYFRRLYDETAGALSGLEAREHTAQVPPEKREDREHQFGDAKLPVLYCSPTMELGVDIKSLNVVGMRNVPPTPANYAQRSGRAGRSGQPAVVLTYCARGSAHDSYYFGRSRDMVAGAVAPPRLELGNEDLVRAHVHAVWLVHTGLDLKATMVDLLDIDAPEQPLRPEVHHAIGSGKAAEQAARHVRTLLGATPEVTAAPWWHDDWIERVMTEAPRRLDRAVDRWRGLYREAQQEIRSASRVLEEIGASEDAKKRSRGQINEARAALDLLKGQIDDVNQGDFYPYRYFASEGFLPGYSFPRLPLAAFIPGERRTRNNHEGDYVQRPRFLAISEFGPGAFIYHEGSRYEVTRVSLPATDDSSGVGLTSFWRCLRCGYLNDGNGPTGTEQCEQCASRELRHMTSQMRLLAVRTRRRDRISADEEERQRAGYEILTSLRFEPRGVASSQQRATITDANGDGLATLAYGDTALIRRMNIGLRRRKDPDVHGYRLDTVDARWISETKAAGLDPQRVPRVVPYVEDHRNALVLELDRRFPADLRMAAMYALKRAIEARYELESSELAAEPMPARDGDHGWEYLLLFEAAEGGAGVLRRLATESAELPAVARRAIELLHYDPDTGADLGRAEHATEPCAQACYDCLLSYGNQWDHQALDRHPVIPLLTALAGATLTPETVGGGDDHLAALYARSNDLEKQFLDVVAQGGFRVPDDAQRLVEGYYARPDFEYRGQGMNAAIFIDGPVHDGAHQAEKDRAAGERLEDEAGWLVLRFRYDDPDWRALMAENAGVFGPGRR